MKTAKDYHSTHLVPFEPFECTGYTSIEVLSFLKGKQWDDVALGYVHALRPNSIRVTSTGVKLDARTWRVTVYITKSNEIKEISQEVEVGLPKGVAHGHALKHALTYDVDGRYYKTTKDGQTVEFPSDPKEVN